MSDERTAAIVRAYIQNLQFTYGEYSMALARCIPVSYTHLDVYKRQEHGQFRNLRCRNGEPALEHILHEAGGLEADRLATCSTLYPNVFNKVVHTVKSL